MADYVKAPACQMLQVHCVCCGRLLLDADSVAQGIGPECRGGLELLEPDIRTIANEHVYHAAEAAMAGKAQEVLEYADLVEKLDENLVALANRMRRRFVKARDRQEYEITIEEDGDRLLVDTPFRRGEKEEFIQAWRDIPGRRFDSERRMNSVPSKERVALWALLRRFFPGKWGMGPKGLFRVV